MKIKFNYTLDNKIEINKSETERFNPPQIQRREIARYYHTVIPRKYSYGDEEIQNSNTIDNHRYREIYETSDNKNKKIVLKSIPKNIKLKSGKIRDNNNKSNDYFSYRYETLDYSPEFLSLKTSEEKLENIPNEKLLFNSNGEIKYSSHINNIKNSNNNNISSGNENEYNLNSGNHFLSSYNRYNTLNNENNNINFRNGQYNITKYDSNRKSKPQYHNNNFESNLNSNLNKENYMPKSYSFTNLNKNKLSNPPFTHNEYNYINENKQMMQPNNIDYDILRQSIKLALLKKQMKEQEKRWSANNGKNYINDKHLKNRNKQIMPRRANDYGILLEKTNKLLENKKYRKESILNYKNNYNRNMLQAKLKMWKP